MGAFQTHSSHVAAVRRGISDSEKVEKSSMTGMQIKDFRQPKLLVLAHLLSLYSVVHTHRAPRLRRPQENAQRTKRTRTPKKSAELALAADAHAAIPPHSTHPYKSSHADDWPLNCNPRLIPNSPGGQKQQAICTPRHFHLQDRTRPAKLPHPIWRTSSLHLRTLPTHSRLDYISFSCPHSLSRRE